MSDLKDANAGLADESAEVGDVRQRPSSDAPRPIRYEIGGDEVWVIGRLPDKRAGSGASSERRGRGGGGARRA
jgi:hypothetical protein